MLPLPFPSLRILPLAMLAFVVAACDSGSTYETVGAQAGQVAVPLGESANLDGLTLAFQAIAEDSRCPEGVDCVWEGRATVRLTVQGADHTLAIVDPEREPDAGVRVGQRVLFAVALTPYPSETAPSSDRPVVTVASFEAR
ncbi:hypothetical protein [Rubrivirga sp. IMCC43871]|uniref:hypothetical protein n=1 Tax=Rubrivirga sp. IMCC43871 TaxID=3391575 RepID=UPI0039903694